MTSKRTRDHGRNAAALAATGFISMLGLAACTFIIASFDGDPTRPLLAVGGSLLALVLLARLLGDKPHNRVLEGKHFWLARKEEPADASVEFTCRRRKRGETHSYGTNRPPTAEEIRELTESQNVWVPNRRAKRPEVQ